MCMTMASVEIRYIRSNNAVADDVTTIRKRHNRDDYLLRYVDGENPRTVWVNEKTYEEVMDHLTRMFEFLLADDDPFKSIQLNIPTMPNVMINVASITRNLVDSILFSISEFLENENRSFRLTHPYTNNGSVGSNAVN